MLCLSENLIDFPSLLSSLRFMVSNLRNAALSVALAGSFCFTAAAVEWPQYRGPSHDGTSPEKILLNWPEGHLREIWKTPLKNGFSTLTTGGGRAYTLITREADGADQEICVALDANTGKEIWAVPLGISKYQGGGDSGAPDNKGGDGSRSSPSFEIGKVYTYSSKMILKCMDAATGREIWASDIIKEHEGKN